MADGTEGNSPASGDPALYELSGGADAPPEFRISWGSSQCDVCVL